MSPIDGPRILLFFALVGTWIYLIRSVILALTGRFWSVSYHAEQDLSSRTIWIAVMIVVLGTLAVCMGFLGGTFMAARVARWAGPSAEKKFVIEERRVLLLLTLAVVGMVVASLVMANLGVGITGRMTPDIPTQVQGFLTYLRLLGFPIVLAVLAAKAPPKRWVLVAALIGAEALTAAACSTSRMVALMHAAPILFLNVGWIRKSALALFTALVSLSVATLFRGITPNLSSRGVVPLEQHSLLANEPLPPSVVDRHHLQVIKELMESIFQFPLQYFVDRSLGLPELFVGSSQVAICSSWWEGSKQWFFAAAPLVAGDAECRGLLELYGLQSGFEGGLNLDPFGGYWFLAGGYIIPYFILMVFIGILFGFLAVAGSRLEQLLSVPYISYLFLFQFILLLFDGRVAMAFTFTVGLGLTAAILERFGKSTPQDDRGQHVSCT